MVVSGTVPSGRMSNLRKRVERIMILLLDEAAYEKPYLQAFSGSELRRSRVIVTAQDIGPGNHGEVVPRGDIRG